MADVGVANNWPCHALDVSIHVLSTAFTLRVSLCAIPRRFSLNLRQFLLLARAVLARASPLLGGSHALVFKPVARALHWILRVVAEFFFSKSRSLGGGRQLARYPAAN